MFKREKNEGEINVETTWKDISQILSLNEILVNQKYIEVQFLLVNVNDR